MSRELLAKIARSQQAALEMGGSLGRVWRRGNTGRECSRKKQEAEVRKSGVLGSRLALERASVWAVLGQSREAGQEQGSAVGVRTWARVRQKRGWEAEGRGASAGGWHVSSGYFLMLMVRS